MDKVKMAVVGAGVWGATHASIYREHPNAEFVAICDKNVARAKAIADEYGVTEVYGDVAEMVEKADCDAVAVVTPDFLHTDIAVTCAQAGKHLLIEKPLATTREDAEKIVAAVEKAGVRCMVDLHNRWSAPYNAAKQNIDKGELGTLQSAYIRLNDIKWVATDMLSWSAQSSILWFLGSHSLDTLRWLFDDEVKRVYAVKKDGVLKKLGVDTTDMYLTTIEFEKGGIAQMENGWITPNGCPNVNDFQCSVLGDKGQISINASHHNLIQMTTEERLTVPDVVVSNMVFGRCKGLSYESIRDFIDRMVDGAPFRVSLEDARRGVMAILAIMESAEKGQPVDVRY